MHRLGRTPDCVYQGHEGVAFHPPAGLLVTHHSYCWRYEITHYSLNFLLTAYIKPTEMAAGGGCFSPARHVWTEQESHLLMRRPLRAQREEHCTACCLCCKMEKKVEEGIRMGQFLCTCV